MISVCWVSEGAVSLLAPRVIRKEGTIVQQLDSDSFVWNDGGRAASGFVGHTGDCVTRAIAIATGLAYKDVYQALADAAGASPRDGMSDSIYGSYLTQRGWQNHALVVPQPFDLSTLPKGVAIVRLRRRFNVRKRSGHLCCVIDRVVHDTWNSSEDAYDLVGYWTHPALAEGSDTPIMAPKQSTSRERELTQAEFDKVLRRLKALDRTAKNEASTDGERRNALRAIQAMMLQNNLTREDIREDDNTDQVSFARISCYVNGTRAYAWESSLSMYVCEHVFTNVQVYSCRGGKRTTLTFYGPLDDVRNAIQLYRELLLTIAALAKQKYGGYTRGSGASYCEGYVAGLPREEAPAQAQSESSVVSATTLIQTRMLALKSSATQWLRDECEITLQSVSRTRRDQFDPYAASHGRVDGASHQIDKPNAVKRLN